MKKICLVFNHLRNQDGVARAAIAIANQLTRLKLAEVTLIPLFVNDSKALSLIDTGVKVKGVFGLYFKGLSKFTHMLPMSLVRWLVFRNSIYDIEVAFQYGVGTRCIAATSHRSHASKYAWMHGYDEGLTLRHAYEKIGTVCCVSRCNAERLHKELPTIRVDYNYNPVDDVQVRLLGAETIDIERPDSMLFVTVGRLSPEKGFGRLLDIMKRLKDSGEKFNLWIIGNGPNEAELKQKRIDLGLEEEVHFLGRQSNPHKFTAKADIFVCSSNVEGYSTACTEAIMLNVPVVTTCVSGAEEIIEEAECGKMTGMDDDSLYSALKEICQKPETVDEWKLKLQETKNRFSAEMRIKRLINLFHLDKQ